MTERIQSTDIETNVNGSKVVKSSDFKILSLDGGGIKGLYAATLLAEIERKTGRPIGDYFDMLCGTSTGGLIALAITNGIPCSEIARFYEANGSSIFPRKGGIDRLGRGLAQFILGTKYSNEALKAALAGVIGQTKTMNDANHLLCIPAFNVTKGEAVVFKKPFGLYHRDGRFTMLQVAMATSAAPTYLPAYTIETDQYVDGGIISNNPSLIGYTEAIDHFIGKTFDKGDSIKYDRLSLLSIGLPGMDLGFHTDAKKDKSFLHWNGDLIKCAMQGSCQVIEYQTRRMINAMNGSSYYRLKPPSLTSAHAKIITMDNSGKRAIQALTSYGQHIGDIFTSTRWNEIESFFINPKTY